MRGEREGNEGGERGQSESYYIYEYSLVSLNPDLASGWG